MNHPFQRAAPWRAAASVVTVLCVAYFVWWGCFAAVVPLPDPCGGLCCPDCSCCTPNSGPSQPYCSRAGEACVIRCEPPNSSVQCACPGGSVGQCACNADGVMSPCSIITSCNPPGTELACVCPTTGLAGTCLCLVDGTMDPCAFIPDAGHP